MPRCRSIVAAVVALAACSPSQAPADSTAPPVGSGFPYLGLTSKAIDLGLVDVGSSADATFTIANVGVADLEVEDVRLVDDEPSIAIDWAGPTTVPAGEFVSVALHWTPTTFTDLASSLEISSNDVVRPLAEIELVGVTPDPDIDVTPATWDFGSVEVGAMTVMGVSIANVGVADLMVTSLDYTASDDDLTIDDAKLPLVVPPSEEVELRVTYRPTNNGTDEGELTIASDDPDEPLVTAGQTGNACGAALDPDATATFSQTANYPDWPRFLVDYAVDSDPVTGWSIYPHGGTAQTAVFELLTDTGESPTTLTFMLDFFPESFELGHFRLSVTDADHSAYGDGLETDGNVGEESIWTILTPLTATSTAATVLDVLDDGSILVDVSTYERTDQAYTVTAETDLEHITGVRLEALTDPSLPNDGPGMRDDGSANFVLSDFRLDCAGP